LAPLVIKTNHSSKWLMSPPPGRFFRLTSLRDVVVPSAVVVRDWKSPIASERRCLSIAREVVAMVTPILLI
jgi:hypothetical protein